MTLKIDDSLLTSRDCFACGKCCRFDPDEIEDAPTFTDEQHERALVEFATEAIRFERRGALWQVVLNDISGSKKKICPFYEEPTGRCRVYNYEIFDCRTWPFYIMRVNGELKLTLSPDCPIVSRIDRTRLAEYARKHIGPRMLNMVKRYPDLVTEYHGNALILCDVSDIENLTSTS